jgi:spore germination protein KA
MVPRLSAPVFFLRLALVGAAVIGGLYGYLLGITLVLISVLNIRSFGVDATSALKNPDGQSLKDTLVRVTWGRMRRRPPKQNNDLKRKR